MPTKHPRIGVVRDEELDVAITTARAITGENADARIVHDLAVAGAKALSEQSDRKRLSLERIAAWSTGEVEPPWDPEVLARVRDEAW